MSTKLNCNTEAALNAFREEYKQLLPGLEESLHKTCTGDLLVDTLNDTLRRIVWILNRKEWALNLIHPCSHKDQVLGVLASIVILSFCPKRIVVHGEHFTLILDNDTKVKVYRDDIVVYKNKRVYIEYCISMNEWDADPEEEEEEKYNIEFSVEY